MYIKKKLPLFMVLLVSIPLIILTATIYFYSSNKIVEINKSKINEIVTVETEHMSVVLNIFSSEIENTSKSEKIKQYLINPSDKNKEIVMEYIQARSENINNEYSMLFKFKTNENKQRYRSLLIGKNGQVLIDTQGTAEGKDYSNEEFYRNSLINKVFMKPIYSDKDTAKLLISVPVVLNKEVIGIYAAYFDIDKIGMKFFSHEVGKNRYSYIVDKNGTILYHPDRQKIGTKVENELVNNIVNRINTGQMITETSGVYEYRGTKKYMAFKYMKDTEWLVIVAQDLTELYAVSRNITFISAFVLLLFLILATKLGINFSKTITNPLTNLMNAMKSAEEGKLDEEFIYTENDEFGSLSKTYNGMIKKLRSNYEELEALYEELTATEEELRAQYDTLIESEEQLRISEERYRIALEAGKNGIFEWNITKDELFISEQFEMLVGHSFKDIKMKELIDTIVVEEDKNILVQSFKEHINGNTKCLECEVRIKTGYGTTRWMFVKGRLINGYMAEQKILAGSLMDITERKEYEEDIKYLAYYDPLTDLPNRRYFIEELEKELNEIEIKNCKKSVFLLDLDNFKKVNDSLGHDKGDELLRKVSAILKRHIDENVFIARFGGDEFLILIRHFEEIKQLKNIAKSIIEDLKDGIDVLGKNIYTTTSIGIALIPDDGKTVRDIIKNADTAMYKAKAEGKNKYMFFKSDMIDELEKKIEIEKTLVDCLNNKGFKLVYQPQIDSNTGEVHAFEALIRIKDKFISPAEFIPVAEETGLIVDIGYYVVEEAAFQIREWLDKGIEVKPIGVNVSAVQLRDEHFVEKVKHAIDKYKISPELIKVEITESALMENSERNIKIIKELKEIGIKIAIDDFGTGYSSLNYLTYIPADYIKLDKSFIDKMFAVDGKKQVLNGVTFLAHQLNLKVVVEGIEDRDQFKYLKSKGCDYMQGYLFSKPVEKEEADRKSVV